MFEDMDDVETLIHLEVRFGPLTKTIPGGWSVEKVEKIDDELQALLQKYKQEKNIRGPLPRIRSWVSVNENKVNFLFFDKATGKRILLGQWLSGQAGHYEH